MEVPGSDAMKRRARTGIIVTAVSVTVSFLTVCVPSVGAAQSASSATAATPTAVVWAYGGLATKAWSGSAGGYSYTSSETVGFAAILTETTGASGSIVLEANRTMGILLSVEYCLASCAHPTRTATISFHEWEVDRAVVNLTTDGSVAVNGTSSLAPALALTSSNLSTVVGLQESEKVVAKNGTVLLDRNLSAYLFANTTTTFSPSLGLVPLALGSGETWTSTSTFSIAGSASYWILSNVLPSPVSGPIFLGATATGNVTLNGTFLGNTTSLGGSSYDVIELSVEGPFALREGFLLVPQRSDLFGTAAPSWLPSQVIPSGSASVTSQYVDVTRTLGHGNHLGFGGSRLAWSSGAANPAADSSGGLVGAVGPQASPQASGSNTTYVQGSPESVSQATTDQSCLASGLGCPGAAGPKGRLGELLVLGGAAAAVVIAIALVAERRRVPPPSYPNSALYPPGSNGAEPPGGVRRPVPPAPPSGDDPLGNLW